MSTERSRLLAMVKAREILDQRAVDQRCSQDPLYWLQTYTQTFDEHAIEKGVQVYKPFPDKPYFPPLMNYCRTAARLAIPKSREMMTSWLVMGYATWLAQWHDHSLCVVQTQKEDKARELVNYASTLWEQQPEWLRKMHPIKQANKGQSNLPWSNGSRVIGVAAGADQVRALHPTLFILDEAAHLAEAQQSYESANPVCSQIILISSAAPGFFADLCA